MLFSVGEFSCQSSGAAMWNLVFEPRRFLTKAAYFWLWLFLRQGI